MFDPITLLQSSIEHAELLAREQNIDLEMAIITKSIEYLTEEPDLEIFLSHNQIEEIKVLQQAREHFASSEEMAECILSMTKRT